MKQRPSHRLSLNRRSFLAGVAGTAVVAGLNRSKVFALASDTDSALNLAKVATPSSLTILSENKIGSLNDGFTPVNSRDRKNGIYMIRRDRDYETDTRTQWVQYDWIKPVSISKIDIYWSIDPPRPNGPPGSGFGRTAAPVSYRILYWDGSAFVPVANAQGQGIAGDTFNATTFDEVKTDKLRLEVVPDEMHAAGIIEWRVYNSGPAPLLPPVVNAGIDRSVMIGAQTYLAGKSIWLQDLPGNTSLWTKVSGPGAVTFVNAASPVTRAGFSAPGDYVLKLAGSGNGEQTVSTINVHAEAAPPKDRLDVVYTRKYSIDSPLWNVRAKTLIVDWIPHCINYCERTDIAANRATAASTTSSKQGRRTAENRMVLTRVTSSRTHGFTRPSNPCASL